MAFKSLTQYQETKNGDFFTLPNDGDFADVIFLYRDINDVIVASDVHYLISSEYRGYVDCCGKGCPACNYGDRGIRLDNRLIIPLYNIRKDKIEFWDRSTFFEQVLQKSVFAAYPVPYQIIFRITRRGEARSRDTKYEISPIARNTSMSYDAILSKFGITFPEGYRAVCRSMTAAEMSAILNNTSASTDLPEYGYTPVPRGESTPEITVPTPQYSAPPEVAPPAMPEYNPNIVLDSSPLEIEPLESPAVEPVTAELDDSSDSLDDVKF